jgi:hypothetical protein
VVLSRLPLEEPKRVMVQPETCRPVKVTHSGSRRSNVVRCEMPYWITSSGGQQRLRDGEAATT